ncbi:MAG: hypothetical protein V7641_1784 [Blastocatellia bacterium]
MKRIGYHIGHLVGIIFVAAVIYFVFLIWLEHDYFLSQRVVPPAEVTLEEWLDSFKFWGTVGILSALAAALVWYILGQLIFKINNWRDSGKRVFWFLLLLLPIIAVVLGIVFTKQAQEGAIFAYLFYALNWVLCYYLATALCSPSAFKYTPPGASAIRRW